MQRFTRKLELEEVAPTAKLFYGGPFDPAHLDIPIVQYRGANPIINAAVMDNSNKWSEIKDDGEPRFKNFLTSGIQKMGYTADLRLQIDVVFYPYYVKLAERGKDVENRAQLEWIRQQIGMGLNSDLTHSFGCAILLRCEGGSRFLLQERSAAGAQNVGKITSSAAFGFEQVDVEDGRLDLAKGAMRGLLQERGISKSEITSFKSSMIAYETELHEFVYVAVADTSLSGEQILERGKDASESWQTESQLLVRLDDADTELVERLCRRSTPFGRISMYAGLNDSDMGRRFLAQLAGRALRD